MASKVNTTTGKVGQRRYRVKGVRNAQTTFQLPQSWKDRLGEIAFQRSIAEGKNVNVTDVINEMLRKYLEDNGGVPPVEPIK